MASTIGEKEIKTEWPVEEGTTARTTKQTGKRFLEAQEGSFVAAKDKVGL